jgi:tRNA A-37 threonylcarbamoyl transferase component Bud32
MYNKRIIIDFDDTLAFTSNRDWERARPNLPLIEKCNKLFDSGWQVDIFTARGSISCKTREEADKKYRSQIEHWLDKHQVKYGLLSFDKPLGAYYIDDKGITPELFLEADIRELEGGLSGSDIYTDGKLVHKTADNAHEAAAWFEYTKGLLNTPRIDRVVGNTITMEYIEHQEDYLIENRYMAFGLIQDALESMKHIANPPVDLVWDDYIGRIVKHVKPTGISAFEDIVDRLVELPQQTASFSHGDFGVKNMLFNDCNLVLIDPIPSSFGNTQLDVSKFVASLIINRYPVDLQNESLKVLCLYNNLNEKSVWTTVSSEIIRVYKYHPDKDFIIQCVNDAMAEIM